MARMSIEQRRALLLESGWQVCSTQSVHAATTRAICARAQMRQSAFHYCFHSRDELLREIVVSLLPNLHSASISNIDAKGTLESVLRGSLMAYWDHVEAEPMLHRVLYDLTSTSLADPRLSDIAETLYRRGVEAVQNVLETIGDIRAITWTVPLPILARLVHSVIDGATLQYIVDRDATAARAALQSFIPMVVSCAVRSEQ